MALCEAAVSTAECAPLAAAALPEIVLGPIVLSQRRHSRRSLTPHTDFGSMADTPRMTSTVHSGCQCADLVDHPQKVVEYPTGLMVPNECPKVRRGHSLA